MSLVKDWRRQAARAMGVSLIAPAALLLAAVVVAAGGGGLGGLGSLGQISSGPTLPDVGPVSNPRVQRDEVALATSGLEPATRAAPPPASTPDPGVAPVSGGDTQRSAAGPRAITPVIPRESQRPVGGQEPVVAVPPAPPVPVATPPAPAPQQPPAAPPAPAAPPPNAVGDLIETTRGLGEALEIPLGPITSDILDTLLGPRP